MNIVNGLSIEFMHKPYHNEPAMLYQGEVIKLINRPIKHGKGIRQTWFAIVKVAEWGLTEPYIFTLQVQPKACMSVSGNAVNCEMYENSKSYL